MNEKNKIKTKKNLKFKKKKRKKKIFFRRIFIILTFLSFIVICGFAIYKGLDYIFGIKEISVQESIYEKNDIISACEIRNGYNLLFVDISSCKKKILSKLPYVESVEISKIMPNKINIKTEIACPKYCIFDGETYFYVSKSGKFLEKSQEAKESIPKVKASKFSISENGYISFENEEVLSIIKELIDNLEQQNFAQTYEIDISNLSCITINYDNRINIILGTADDLSYKISTLGEIIKNKIKDSEKGKLDISRLNENNRSYFTPDI